MRRALPTLAAVAALALAGCSSDDKGSSSDSENTAEASASSDASAKPEEKDEDSATAGQEGAADEEGTVEQSDADAEGTGPSPDDLYGYWATQSDGDDASLLFFSADQVLFVENLQPEGDTCTGTVTNGALSVTCKQAGDSAWEDTEATVAIAHSPQNIDVTWASGTKLSYYRVAQTPNDVPDAPKQKVPEIDEWLDYVNTH